MKELGKFYNIFWIIPIIKYNDILIRIVNDYSLCLKGADRQNDLQICRIMLLVE